MLSEHAITVHKVACASCTPKFEDYVPTVYALTSKRRFPPSRGLINLYRLGIDLNSKQEVQLCK